MPRFYLNNDSYPELREIHPQWARTLTWWRAIRRATRHRDFWSFVGLQAGVLGGFLATDIALAAVLRVPDRVENVAHIAFAAGALAAFMYLQVSVGGDMMRRHLRAVSAVARFACPTCGHSLVGHLGGDEPTVRCPECASDVGRSTFEPPFPIPPRDRAFPPWRRSRSHPP